MPPRPKPPRLWLRPARRNKAGRIISRAVYIILDRDHHEFTGCFEGEIDRAQQVLAEYITDKYRPDRRERELEAIKVADVLSIYYDDFVDQHSHPKRFRARISRLNDFFGDLPLSAITGAKCREYVKHRGNAGGARRDLEDLRAAINYHAKEGFHRGTVRVVLPEKGPPRDLWLTRDEVAALVRTCWRTRETQTISRGARAGTRTPTDRYPLRHLVPFILIGIYTGTRPGAILTASHSAGPGRSWADLERGIFYRLAQGKRATNKRQPPVPIPPRLLAHMRRWVRRGLVMNYFVEWAGRPVQSVKVGFGRAVVAAGLKGKVTPHTLRHTAATWLMQQGVPMWEAAGFLGMSPEMLERTYGHHHPDFMRGAADAIGKRTMRPHSLVIPLVRADGVSSPAKKSR